jgi:integrase
MATSLDPATLRSGRAAVRALNDLSIRNLKPGERRTDDALPVGNGRLVVTCVKARGQLRRVWTFRYRKSDTKGEVKIGEHPALSLEQARSEARTLIELVRKGGDPKVARFEQRQAAVEAARRQAALGTFGALLDVYTSHLMASKKVSASEVVSLFKRHVKSPWPALVKLPANQIAPETIRDILARLVRMSIGRQTNVLRSYLQAAFTHGAHSDLDPRRAAADGAVFRLTSNPVTLLPRIQEYEKARDRVLTDDELRHFWLGLNGVRLELGHALRVALLLGGQRFKQLLRATWSDYDANRKVLELADPKGKRTTAVPHLLPIGPRVAALLEELRALNGSGTYVFSTSAGAKPIHGSSLSNAVREITAQRDGSVEIYQGRDIRRTVETRLQAVGVTREVRAQLLSHGRTSGVQQKHYERYQYLPEKTAALDAWQRHLLEVCRRKRQASAPRAHRATPERPGSYLDTKVAPECLAAT